MEFPSLFPSRLSFSMEVKDRFVTQLPYLHSWLLIFSKERQQALGKFLLRFPCWVGTSTKSNLRRKCFQLPGFAGTQAGSWSSKRRPQRKAAHWLPFLQCAHWLSHPTQDCLPRDDLEFNGLSLPASVTKQENTPHAPVGQSAGGNSSAETPFPQQTLMCVKLTFNPAIPVGTQLQYSMIPTSKFTLLFWLLIHLDRMCILFQ